MRYTDHLFYFCKPSSHQPETLFNEEFCQVSKDLLSKDIQIGTPNPEVFQFLVFDRGSLLARLTKYTEERGFCIRLPKVRVLEIGASEELDFRCKEDGHCAFSLVYR